MLARRNHVQEGILNDTGAHPAAGRVLLTQAEPMMHHRTPAYADIFVKAMQGLKDIFLTTNDILIFTSSGTGAMEAAIVNSFSPGDKVLVPHGGKFGERFRDLGRVYGLEVLEYIFEWGDTADPAVIAKRLAADPDIKGVLVTHSETSTGVVNDIATIGEIVRPTPAILIVDSISGAGALEMRTDDWGGGYTGQRFSESSDDPTRPGSRSGQPQGLGDGRAEQPPQVLLQLRQGAQGTGG